MLEQQSKATGLQAKHQLWLWLLSLVSASPKAFLCRTFCISCFRCRCVFRAFSASFCTGLKITGHRWVCIKSNNKHALFCVFRITASKHQDYIIIHRILESRIYPFRTELLGTTRLFDFKEKKIIILLQENHGSQLGVGLEMNFFFRVFMFCLVIRLLYI